MQKNIGKFTFYLTSKIAYLNVVFPDLRWLKTFDSTEFKYYKNCLDNELSLKIEKSLNNIEAGIYAVLSVFCAICLKLKLKYFRLQDYKFQCDEISRKADQDSRKRKSRWSSAEPKQNQLKSEPIENESIETKPERKGFGFADKSIKNEPDNANEFLIQVKMATERAKNIAEQINEQIQLYPEGYTSNTNQACQQQKQFREQKDVWF